jgi:hypothetical protein
MSFKVGGGEAERLKHLSYSHADDNAAAAAAAAAAVTAACVAILYYIDILRIIGYKYALSGGG